MNPLIESLWDALIAREFPEDPEIEGIRTLLYAKLDAAVNQDFTGKVRDINTEAEEFAARAAFARGFCLGGKLVAVMLA